MVKSYHERKLEEQRRAEILQQRADIDYIAMMADIELPNSMDEEAGDDE